MLDITHGIPPQAVSSRRARRSRTRSRTCPRGVHLAVVDPERRRRPPRDRVARRGRSRLRRARQRPADARCRALRRHRGAHELADERYLLDARSRGPSTAETSSRPPPPISPSACRSRTSARRSTRRRLPLALPIPEPRRRGTQPPRHRAVRRPLRQRPAEPPRARTSPPSASAAATRVEIDPQPLERVLRDPGRHVRRRDGRRADPLRGLLRLLAIAMSGRATRRSRSAEAGDSVRITASAE